MEKTMNAIAELKIDKQTLQAEYAEVHEALRKETIYTVDRCTTAGCMLVEFERDGKRVTFGSIAKTDAAWLIHNAGGMNFTDIEALCTADRNAHITVAQIADQYWMYDDAHDDFEAGHLFGCDCSRIADPEGKHFYY